MRFVPPSCDVCGGPLKPDVVFFGHNVARPVVDRAFAMLDEAEALLVAGTSLAVFSGYRFLLRAALRGMPIAIVNRGPVRGEDQATGLSLHCAARQLNRTSPGFASFTCVSVGGTRRSVGSRQGGGERR